MSTMPWPIGVDASTLTVTHATRADLPGAQHVMREVLDRDLGGYRPEWHTDLDDLERAHLGDPRRALLVARDGDRVLGTAAVRPCVLASPPSPAWLAAEYNRPDVCQLVRVWVSGADRRRGTGRALVRHAVAWSIGPGGYRRVYLHTDASVTGAEAFWRSLPTREVQDSRPDPFHCVHFEIDVPALLGLHAC